MEKVKQLSQYRDIRAHLEFYGGTLYDKRESPWKVLEHALQVPRYRYFHRRVAARAVCRP